MTINIDFDHNNTFWANNDIIFEIIKEISEKKCITVRFNTEGPCAEVLGVYDLLENICNFLSVPHKNVEIQTHNQIERHPSFKITKLPLAHSFPTVQNEFVFDKKYHIKNIDDQYFKHLGCFVGRTSWDRLWLSSYLYEHHKDRIIQTYHYDLNFNKQVSGFDKVLTMTGKSELIPIMANFLQKCPMHGSDTISNYPISIENNLEIYSEYPKFFAELSCETYPEGDTFFPTEKIWRPIVLKTPFIVSGPVGFLKNLRKLGFKTFYKWWSEEYDHYGHHARVEKITEVINYICTLQQSELNTIYMQMQDVLDHNYELFYKLSIEDFKNAFGHNLVIN